MANTDAVAGADSCDRIRTANAVGYLDHKAEHLTRLTKIEGQIRGVNGMIAHDRYCIDVLTQISAATHALQAVEQSLIDDYIRRCVLNAAHSEPTRRVEQLDELAHTVRTALRL